MNKKNLKNQFDFINKSRFEKKYNFFVDLSKVDDFKETKLFCLYLYSAHF